MIRKLASVQRVLEVVPIVGADAIEAVRINGWQCVVKKGAFSVGDRGVFFEIDAVPPDLPAYRFLWTPKAAAPDKTAPHQKAAARPCAWHHAPNPPKTRVLLPSPPSRSSLPSPPSR